MYKTMVIEYLPKAKKMAARVEEAANKMEQKGYELISFTVTPSAKGILVFKKNENEAPDSQNVPDK